MQAQLMQAHQRLHCMHMPEEIQTHPALCAG